MNSNLYAPGEAPGTAASSTTTHAALTTGVHGVGASTVLSAATAAATYAPVSHAMTTHSDWPTRHGWSTSQTLAAVDAGPFTLDFTVPDGTVWNYYVRATARRSNGGVGDAGKGASYQVAGAIRRLPGGATMHIGAAVTFLTVTEFGGGGVALSANGNDLRITVTGVAGINAFWVVDLEWTANAGT